MIQHCSFRARRKPPRLRRVQATRPDSLPHHLMRVAPDVLGGSVYAVLHGCEVATMPCVANGPSMETCILPGS